MTKTVVGIYRDFQTAGQVVRELVDSGFDRNRISVIAGDENRQYASQLERDTGTRSSTTEDVGKGAGIGAAIGGVGGLLVGLGALAIPGIGPVIAAGPIAAGLAGAGIGAAAGGVIGALVDLGIPEDDANTYAESVRRGSVLVAVETTDDRVDHAARIMERAGLVDLDRDVNEWRSAGWTRFDAGDTTARSKPRTDTTRRTETTRRQSETGDQKFEVIEEDVKIGKRTVENSGGVRVRSFMREVPVEEQVRLREEHVDVERRPVDRPARPEDMKNFQEGTFEVKESREEAVISKDARVVEEVVVHKDVDERVETVRDTARRTDVEVERTGGQSRTTDTGFDRYDKDFRSHYQSSYGNRGGSYDRYQPAYRYGYTLANDDRYRGREWRDVESEARREWESRNRDQGPWEDFKDAVQHGWYKVTGRR
jgi:stress response protein YsnF